MSFTISNAIYAKRSAILLNRSNLSTSLVDITLIATAAVIGALMLNGNVTFGLKDLRTIRIIAWGSIALGGGVALADIITAIIMQHIVYTTLRPNNARNRKLIQGWIYSESGNTITLLISPNLKVNFLNRWYMGIPDGLFSLTMNYLDEEDLSNLTPVCKMAYTYARRLINPAALKGAWFALKDQSHSMTTQLHKRRVYNRESSSFILKLNNSKDAVEHFFIDPDVWDGSVLTDTYYFDIKVRGEAGKYEIKFDSPRVFHSYPKFVNGIYDPSAKLLKGAEARRMRRLFYNTFSLAQKANALPAMILK